MALSDLLNDTSVLLNDQTYSFTSKTQLTRWVNEARRNCAKRTGCIRRLLSGNSAFGASSQPGVFIPGAAQPGALPGAIPAAQAPQGQAANSLNTIPNVERYPYQGFFNPYLQASYAGVDYILDTITCAVNWGGTTRPVLDWLPWDDFQAYCRSYAVLNSAYPAIWSVFNDGPTGEIWLFPIPSQVCEFELDVTCAPKSLYSDDDYDAIPDAFQEALKYKAASIAFESSQRYAQAQAMEDRFADNLGIARVAVDRGKTKSYYYSAY